MSDDHLTRSELIALGRGLVTERLQQAGHSVAPATTNKLDVTTASGRALEVFVSTQRIGGYAVWPKRRFQPAPDRYVAIALLGDGDAPDLYLIPSSAWEQAEPPFKDRDNVGKKSEAEFGVALNRSALPALERYRWDDAALLTP